jgi:hypothetical protein
VCARGFTLMIVGKGKGAVKTEAKVRVGMIRREKIDVATRRNCE